MIAMSVTPCAAGVQPAPDEAKHLFGERVECFQLPNPFGPVRDSTLQDRLESIRRETHVLELERLLVRADELIQLVDEPCG